jgi:putative effector of murein hydrolase LrgA (UPF0299 family)
MTICKFHNIITDILILGCQLAQNLAATGILTKFTYSDDRTAHCIQLQLSNHQKHHWTRQEMMPCHAHYVTCIPFCVLCDIFIQHCARCLTFIPQCVGVVHYFYSMLWILRATFFPCCVFCVTFIPHCVLCVTFVPQYVCIVKYFSFRIVCGQHSFCSMLCVLCGTFIPSE